MPRQNSFSKMVMQRPMMKSPSKPMPKSTEEAGPLTPTLKTKLSKEAPETLKQPKRGSFKDGASYGAAMQKWRKNKNWASKE